MDFTEVRRLNMIKNFLMTGYYFNGYHGSMMHICEIGEYLAAQGWTVGVVSVDITPEIRRYVEAKGIHLYDVDTVPKDIIWQYALCYHFPILPYLLRQGLKIEKIGIGSLSSYMPLESPSFLAKEAFLPVFVHSKSLKDKLAEDYGLEKSRIFILPNLVPDRFRQFAKEEPSQSLKHIAMVSNHVPDEIREAAALLRESGITTDFFGAKDKFVPVTPELLTGYDCIVTIGKTVQYALALEIPVYNYDWFGGEGYICLTNIDEEEAFNFSGRRTRRKLNSEDLAREITSGFSAAAGETKALQNIAYRQYFVSYNVERIISILDGWEYHPIQETPDNKMYFDFCCFAVSESYKYLYQLYILRNQFANAENQLNDAQSQLKDANVQLTDVKNQLAAVHKELRFSRAAYNAISNSRLWRITKPIRVILDCLKSLFKGRAANEK